MTLTPILKGERIQRAAEGTVGIVRRPAPAHGISIDTGPDNEPVFLSEEEVRAALSALSKRIREEVKP